MSSLGDNSMLFHNHSNTLHSLVLVGRPRSGARLTRRELLILPIHDLQSHPNHEAQIDRKMNHRPDQHSSTCSLHLHQERCHKTFSVKKIMHLWNLTSSFDMPGQCLKAKNKNPESSVLPQSPQNKEINSYGFTTPPSRNLQAVPNYR